MIKYRIWYLDGTIIEGETQEDWIAAPDQDVLVVAVFMRTDDHGRKIGDYYAYSDWYWMHEGKIYQNNVSSATDYGVWVENTAPEGAISKRAVWTTNEHMELVVKQMWDWLT